MSVREYRDAYREFERVKVIVADMKEDLNLKIASLEQDITEAEIELEDDRKKAQELGRKLKGPFMTKVDNDMVFRLANNQPVQIVTITEE